MKIKLNWGTGLAIGMIAFILFIMNFVIRIATQKKYNHDLVTDKYYQKELVFQKVIDAEKNARALKQDIVGHKNDLGYVLKFPEEFDDQTIKGTVTMYRPSNRKLDFEQPLEISNSTFLVPKEKLLPGRWDLMISWHYEGKAYYYKDKLFY